MDALIQFWHQVQARPDFWGLVSIPFVAAFVTWGHVWIALQMVFFPLEFIGYKPLYLGWQGIIPRKARKMSGILVDKVINKLGSVSDFLRQMEPDKIAHYVGAQVTSRLDDYVDQIMLEESPVLWANLPMMIKNRVYQHARRNVPTLMDDLVTAIIADIDHLVDVREMVCSQLESNRGLMVRMFREVGSAEFRFIVNVSFWIGLSFGVIQLVLFYFLPWHAMLPLYAAVLGLATNWLALAMVFRPLNPVRIGPIRLQGLFLRRQNEVAEKFAELSSQELLTIGQFMREILTGKKSAQARLIIKRHLSPLLDAPVVRTALQMTMGPQGFADLKSSVADMAVDMAMEPLSEEAFNKDRAVVLSKLFSEKIRALTSAEFQDLLRPAFQEDEWILLVLGAVTGLIAGWLQLVIGFA